MEIGEIRRGKDIGKGGVRNHCKYIWAVCIRCGGERWVRYVKEQPMHDICLHCAQIERGHNQREINKKEPPE